jgi:glycine dehydrogenase
MVNLDFNIDRKTNDSKSNNSVQTESLATHTFASRHIGVGEAEIKKMLDVLGVASLNESIDKTVPQAIRLNRELDLPPALTEAEALAKLKAIASNNQVYRYGLL